MKMMVTEKTLFETKLSFFLLTSLLEYNCFTMVCYFLLYNKVNQLYTYIYPHLSCQRSGLYL